MAAVFLKPRQWCRRGSNSTATHFKAVKNISFSNSSVWLCSLLWHIKIVLQLLLLKNSSYPKKTGQRSAHKSGFSVAVSCFDVQTRGYQHESQKVTGPIGCFISTQKKQWENKQLKYYILNVLPHGARAHGVVQFCGFSSHTFSHRKETLQLSQKQRGINLCRLNQINAWQTMES